MKQYKRILIVLVFLVNGFPGIACGGWNIMTEELPPFNFTRDGQVHGISTDILLELMKRTGNQLSRQEIRMMPWPRAYNTVLNTPGSMLFSAARTPQREELFKWVGPIMELTIGLIARKGRHIRIETIEDARKYRIGTIRDGAPEQLVVKAGIPESSLDRIANPELNIKKLKSGRIDLFAFNIPTTRYLMIKMGIDPDAYEVVYTSKQAELYYAFHKDTDDGIIEILNRGLHDLKKPDDEGSSFVDRTVNRYLSLPE